MRSSQRKRVYTMSDSVYSARTRYLVSCCEKNEFNNAKSGNSENLALEKTYQNNKETLVTVTMDSENVFHHVVPNESETSKNYEYHINYDDFMVDVQSNLPTQVSSPERLYQENNNFADNVFTTLQTSLPTQYASNEDLNLLKAVDLNNMEIINSDNSVEDPDYEPDSEEAVVLKDNVEIEHPTKDDGEKENIHCRNTNGNSSSNINNKKVESNKKKRGKKPHKTKEEEKLIRKSCRNTGRAYLTKTGKLINARKPKPLKLGCRRKCSERLFDKETLKSIFTDYWNLGDYSRRVAYIASLIKCEPKKTATTMKSELKGKDRQMSFYYFIEARNERKQVCKECFCRVFDETPKFIFSVTKNKLSSITGITHNERRGKHVPANKISDDRIDAVIEHIKKFPAYESHYSRKHTEKKYLSPDLNKQKMYSLYCKEVAKPVSIKIYSQEIDNLNLKFKKPSNDTCNTCDTLQMKIQMAKNIDEKGICKRQLDEHHIQAEMAYNCKKVDKERVVEDPKLKVLVFDLQQVLPTPFLTSGTVFYKRQLHTYNLTIHDCSNNVSSHFMWHEAIAGRGANEIASCLYKYLSKVDEEVEHVILYSDTCGGQNKNSHVAAMFTYLMSVHPTLKQIEHKFLIPGHSHMECDSDHAIIEKYKKKSPFPIHLPRDWYQLVRLAGNQKVSTTKKNTNHEEIEEHRNRKHESRFKVEVMRKEDFYDFANLLKGPLVNRKVDEQKEKFEWRPCKCLLYKRDFGIIGFKHNLDDKDYKLINFKRKVFNKEIILPQLYNEEKEINSKKKQNLIEMLDLIDEDAREFYRKLKTSGNNDNKDTDPDIDFYFSDEDF